MLCLAALILWGCDQRQGFLPSPGGKPYEVLVVGDRDSLVAQSLSTDVECLPQPEPQFDVSTTDSAHFTGSLRLARAIVVVTVDDAAYTGFRMRYEKNVYAKPQIIVYIGAPDEATLCKGLTAAQGDNLRKLLNHFEANAQLLRLRHQRNIKAERRIRQMFGIDIWVPADMIASKEGPDFLWLSNNSATSMENLVIYRDWHKTGASQATHNDGTEASVGRFIATRDSILGSNIPGERDNMHVATVPGAVMVRADHLFFRGLWEMTHDDMGGPFVSRLLPLKEPTTKGPWTCQDIVAEGFVFAPGKSKRNAVRRLEAVLYSMKWAQDQDKSQGKERPKGNR
jgi:hypothetical protein